MKSVRVRDLCGIDRKATNGAIALVRLADDLLSRAVLARQVDECVANDDPSRLAGDVKAHSNVSERTLRS